MAVTVSIRVLSMSLIIIVLLIRVRVLVLVAVVLLMLLSAVVGTILALPIRISVIRLTILRAGTKSSVDLSSRMLSLRLLCSILGVLAVLRVYRLFRMFHLIFMISFIPFIFIIHNRYLLSVLKFSMFLYVLKDVLLFSLFSSP